MEPKTEVHTNIEIKIKFEYFYKSISYGQLDQNFISWSPDFQLLGNRGCLKITFNYDDYLFGAHPTQGLLEPSLILSQTLGSTHTYPGKFYIQKTRAISNFFGQGY